MSSESRPQPVPSWPTVIATTLRLWLQRHVISPRPNRGQHGHYCRLGLTVLAVVVLGALVVVVSVVRGGAAYLRRLLVFLRAQRPPLRPLVSLRHHNRTTDVQIKFSAPSPTGLLGAGESP